MTVHASVCQFWYLHPRDFHVGVFIVMGGESEWGHDVVQYYDNLLWWEGGGCIWGILILAKVYVPAWKPYSALS